MSRIELHFKGGPNPRQFEVRANSLAMEVHINGRPVVDGETYMIHGSTWRLASEKTDGDDGTRRFRCTFVA